MRHKKGKSAKQVHTFPSATRFKAPEWTDTIDYKGQKVRVFGFRQPSTNYGKLLAEGMRNGTYYYIYRDTRREPHDYSKPDENWSRREIRRTKKG